jgi:hypothetical protein
MLSRALHLLARDLLVIGHRAALHLL